MSLLGSFKGRDLTDEERAGIIELFEKDRTTIMLTDEIWDTVRRQDVILAELLSRIETLEQEARHGE